MPTFLCNIIKTPVTFTNDYDVKLSSSPGSRGSIKDSQGNEVTYSECGRPLFNIKVRSAPDGRRLGPYALLNHKSYVVSRHRDYVQQRRWYECKHCTCSHQVRVSGKQRSHPRDVRQSSAVYQEH